MASSKELQEAIATVVLKEKCPSCGCTAVIAGRTILTKVAYVQIEPILSPWRSNTLLQARRVLQDGHAAFNVEDASIGDYVYIKCSLCDWEVDDSKEAKRR